MGKAVDLSTTKDADASSTFLTVPNLSFGLHANSDDWFSIKSIYKLLGNGPNTDIGKCYTTSDKSYSPSYGGSNGFNTYPKKSKNTGKNWFCVKGGSTYDWPGSIFSNCTGYAWGRALHWIRCLEDSGVNTEAARKILNLCSGTPPVWADKNHAKKYLKSKESIRPGGFLIWEKNGAPGQGHVAFVESVKLSSKGEVKEVIISESSFHEYPWSNKAGTTCNATNQGFSIVNKSVGSSNPVAYGTSWGKFVGFIDLGLYELCAGGISGTPASPVSMPSLFTKTGDKWWQFSDLFTKIGGVWYPIHDAYYKFNGKWLPLTINKPEADKFTSEDGWVNYGEKFAPRVCTDGSNHTLPDANWQSGTALSNPKTGKALDAYRVPYVVQPVVQKGGTISWAKNPTGGNMLRYKARIINTKTNKAVEAVVGESGPYANGWGEVSIYCLWKTGYPNHGTGNSSPTSEKIYQLQFAIDDQGNYVKVDDSFWSRYPDNSITKLPPGK